MITSTQTLAIILTASICTFLIRVAPFAIFAGREIPALCNIWEKSFQLQSWRYWWSTA